MAKKSSFCPQNGLEFVEWNKAFEGKQKDTLTMGLMTKDRK